MPAYCSPPSHLLPLPPRSSTPSPQPPGVYRASAHALLPLAGVMGFISIIYDCCSWNGKEKQNLQSMGGYTLCTGDRPGWARPLSPRSTTPAVPCVCKLPMPTRPALLPLVLDWAAPFEGHSCCSSREVLRGQGKPDVGKLWMVTCFQQCLGLAFCSPCPLSLCQLPMGMPKGQW